MEQIVNEIHFTANKLNNLFAEADWEKIEIITTKSGASHALPALKKIEIFASDVLAFKFQYVSVEELQKFKSEFEHIEAQVRILLIDSEKVGDIHFLFNKEVSFIGALTIIEYLSKACPRFLTFVNVAEYLENTSINVSTNAAKENVKKAKEDFHVWLKGIKDTTAQREAAIKYSGVFSTEAKRFYEASRKWLSATICLLAATIAIAIWFLLSFEQLTGNTEVIQFTITKVIITVVLFYGINMCVKSFRANKHNQILNEHRHNALQTLEVFQKSSNDEQTKSAVLMEVTRTIFGNQQTGYGSPSDGEGDNMPTKFIEIIKQTQK